MQVHAQLACETAIVSLQPLKLISFIYAELYFWDLYVFQRHTAVVLPTVNIKLSFSSLLSLAYSTSIIAHKKNYTRG